jgi:hypothetical protein
LFAELLEPHESERCLVVKINGEFRGRGIATLKINPAKSLKGGDRECKDKKKTLIDALRSSLRLKLKVNF